MRHGKKFNHLSRKRGHRKALLKNLAISLITYKRITTTLAKARALRQYIEPMMTRAKNAASEETIARATHHRRVVFSHLQNKEAVKELFGDIASKIADRPGGYIRILKTGFRPHDGAETALIELVDYNTDALETQTTKRKRTRRGRSKKQNTDNVAVVENAEDTVVDSDGGEEEE